MHVFGRRQNGLALHLVTEAGEVFQLRDRLTDVGAHLGDGVAGIHHLDAQNLVGALGEAVGELVQILAALHRREFGPFRLCRFSGLHGGVDILLAAERHAADNFLGRRIDRLHPAAAFAADQLAADQHRHVLELGGTDGFVHGITLWFERMFGPSPALRLPRRHKAMLGGLVLYRCNPLQGGG